MPYDPKNEPWSNGDHQQESLERRPEWLRILMYMLLAGVIFLLGMLLNQNVINWIAESSNDLPIGKRVMIYSYCIASLLPQLMMLVNRRFTFRSNRPLLSCMLRMEAGIFIINGALRLVMMLAARFEGTEVLFRLSQVMPVLEQVGYYLYQRYFLFRDSLDSRVS